MRRAFSQNNRLGQTALSIQPEIVFFRQFGDAVSRKKIGVDLFFRALVGKGFGAAFAKLGDRPFSVRVGPGTGLAIDAALLIES